jgi:protein-S-isoprenylcysteine O-methyltransferase Ste14
LFTLLSITLDRLVTKPPIIMVSDDRKHKNKLILRGIKQSSPIGTGLFLGLRTLDPVLQYGILAKGIAAGAIHKLGGKTLAQGPPVVTNTFLDRLALSPYRMILLAMAAGSAIKQNYWLVGICQEEFPPVSAVEVSVFNTVFNSVNSLLFTCSMTSASVNGEHFPQTPLMVGSALYVVGIFTETFSEWQRLQFKKNPANKGKVYTGGLFRFARHINYAGYTLWRAGYALAAGGWTWGAIVGAFFSYNFISEGIPELNKYCHERVSFTPHMYGGYANSVLQYGEQWSSYRKQTPYKLFPYIY